MPSVFNPIFIGLHGDLDWSKVCIDDPVKNENANGNVWYTSSVYFKDDNGQKRSMFFQLEEQQVWGISGIWPMGTDREDQILDTLEGYQVAYPLTSRNTVQNPTMTELKTQQNFDNIRKTTSLAFRKFCEAEKDRKKSKSKDIPIIVPPSTYSSYLNASEGDDIEEGVKPIYNFSTKKDMATGKSTVDKTIPMKAYIKLKSYKEKDGETHAKCATSILGPGNKNISVLKYLQLSDDKKETRGKIKSVMLWEDIYWGQHGNSTYGCSARIKIVELHYNPESPRDITGPSFLGPNNTPEEEEEDEDEDLLDDFQSPKPEIPVENGNQLKELLADISIKDDDLEDEPKPSAKKVLKKKKTSKK